MYNKAGVGALKEMGQCIIKQVQEHLRRWDDVK
jgi:hypothetical protein